MNFEPGHAVWRMLALAGVNIVQISLQSSLMKWWIGCSGFYYNHWRNIFYPEDLPKSKWFDFYKEKFNTLELNVTFYRFPKLNVFENWYKDSPKQFRFAVKAPRVITHFKQFHDTPKMMKGYYATMGDGLREKLGCVLFQLPSRSAYTEERLERIIDTLDPGFHNVLEFRHPSWWNETVFKILKKHKISFSGISHPALPEDVIQNTSIIYYRFHGKPDLYKSPYELPFLKHVFNEVDANTKNKEAYLYFNNDIDGSAIKNARQLQKLVTGQSAKMKSVK